MIIDKQLKKALDDIHNSPEEVFYRENNIKSINTVRTALLAKDIPEYMLEMVTDYGFPDSSYYFHNNKKILEEFSLLLCKDHNTKQVSLGKWQERIKE